VEELSTNCGRGRKSWWLTFYGVTHRLVLRKSPAVKSDTEPIATVAHRVPSNERIISSGCCSGGVARTN